LIFLPVILIFNQDKYKDLLIKYQPKMIRIEEENDRALAIVEDLMHRSNRNLEEAVGFPG
jgi:HTH-type transcriptional regulator / antitoxin HigA